MMNSPRWERIQQLFYAASEMEPLARESYLDAECASEPELRSYVDSLIRSGEDPPDTLVAESVSLLAASAVATAPGDRIGNYEVIRELGRGGMGSVFLAVRADDHYRKQVAIKLVNMAVADTEVRSRFRAERQILADLDHPNIARMLDGGSTPAGLPYVVMEYIEGAPVDVYCREQNLNLRQRLALFRQLCEAIIYAHRNLIVHRDIKPANVLVSPDGVPKLLDFGIARLLRDDAIPLTRASDRVMTPQYASPEQARGEAISTASDVYSLGVLLHELLTGQMPARGRSPELGRDLDNILLMSIREEPARRYGSVEAFSDDIRRYLEGFPVAARSDTWTYRARKFIGRHTWGVAAAAAVLALLIGFGAAMALLARRVSFERDHAETERRNAEQVSKFLIDSFSLADPSGTQGQTLTAKQVLDRGAERVDRELASQPAVRARLLNTVGQVYRSIGIYDRSEDALNRALKANPDPDTMLALGQLFDTKGDFATAETWYRKALAQERRPAEAAGIEAALGQTLISRSRDAEAEPFLTQSLDTRKRLFGVKSAAYADSLYRLGELYANRHHPDRAESFYRQSLAIGIPLLGTANPDTATTMGALAAVLSEAGKYTEAENFERQALASHRLLYGNANVMVGDDLSTLGVLRFRSGSFTQSLALHREAAAIYRAALGPESTALAYSLVQTAATLERLGNLPEAEAAIREGIAMNAKLLGEHHPLTAGAEQNLANILSDQGRYTEAESILTRVLRYEDTHHVQDPMRSYKLTALAAARRAQGDFEGAARALGESLDLTGKMYGQAHPEYAAVLARAAFNGISRGRLEESEAMLRRAIEICRKAQPNSYELSYPLTVLAQDLLLQGRAVEAEKNAREALEVRKKTVPAADLRYALTESILGGSLAALHRDEEARPLLVHSHEVLAKSHDRSLAVEQRRLTDFEKGRR